LTYDEPVPLVPVVVVEIGGTLQVQSESISRTKAVVAICVVFVLMLEVVERGVPVKVGEANAALVVSVSWT